MTAAISILMVETDAQAISIAAFGAVAVICLTIIAVYYIKHS